MENDRDNRRLTKQLSSLKKIEENLTEKLEPLHDEAINIKFGGLKALVEHMEMCTLEPLSKQSIEEIKEK